MNYPTKQISLLKVRETEFLVDPASNVKKRATVSPWQDKESSVAEARESPQAFAEVRLQMPSTQKQYFSTKAMINCPSPRPRGIH